MTQYILTCALLAVLFISGWIWLQLIACAMLFVAIAWAIADLVQGARNLWAGVFRRF